MNSLQNSDQFLLLKHFCSSKDTEVINLSSYRVTGVNSIFNHLFSGSDFQASLRTPRALCQLSVHSFRTLFVKLRFRSRSSPGPFLVHSKSILGNSNLFQFKIRLSGPGADAIFTVPPTTTQQTFLELMIPQIQFRQSYSHDILIILWRQLS